MPVDSRILAAIADPTGGKLGQIGQTIVQSKQLALEGERKARAEQVAAEERQWTEMDRGTKAVIALSEEAIDWKTANPTSTDDEFKAFQDEQYANAPDPLKPYARKEYQTLGQFQQGYKHAEGVQRAFHPDQYKEKDRSVDAISGYVIDKEGNRITSGILSKYTGEAGKLINGKHVPLETGEQFIEGSVKDTSATFGKIPKLDVATQDWRKRIVMGGEKARGVIASNKAILQLNKSIEGGSFTEMMAKGGNVLQSVFGIDPSFITDNDPATVFAQVGINAGNALKTSGEDLKGSTSDRDLKTMMVAQGTGVDNPNEAVMFMGKQIISNETEKYIISKEYDDFTAGLGRKSTDSDDAKFRKEYREKREKEPKAVIFDKTAGHKGFAWKWEYDIKTDNAVDRALASLAPLAPDASSEAVSKWVGNRNKVEKKLRDNAKAQWISFAAKHR